MKGRTLYPDEIIKQGALLREQGLTWKQIANELGGTEHSWRGLISRRLDLVDKNQPEAYQKGQVARTRSRAKKACPYEAYTQNWSWWMAGWNDQDMEVA